MSEHDIFSMGDGNCCFNAFLLAWTQAFINDEPHSEPTDFLDEIKNIFGPPSISQDDREWLKTNLLADPHHYQRTLSACLRRRVFEYLRAHYFDGGYHENYYRGQLEKLFETYRADPKKADDSQHFLAHPSIVEKLISCANPESFLDWWVKEGYVQYFTALKIPAEHATDYARYAGQVELAILGRLFLARVVAQVNGIPYDTGDIDGQAQWSMTLRYAGAHWDFVDTRGKEGPDILPLSKKEEPPLSPPPKAAIPIPFESSVWYAIWQSR